MQACIGGTAVMVAEKALLKSRPRNSLSLKSLTPSRLRFTFGRSALEPACAHYCEAAATEGLSFHRR